MAAFALDQIVVAIIWDHFSVFCECLLMQVVCGWIGTSRWCLVPYYNSILIRFIETTSNITDLLLSCMRSHFSSSWQKKAREVFGSHIFASRKTVGCHTRGKQMLAERFPPFSIHLFCVLIFRGNAHHSLASWTIITIFTSYLLRFLSSQAFVLPLWSRAGSQRPTSVRKINSRKMQGVFPSNCVA